jgi:hypothetical protein
MGVITMSEGGARLRTKSGGTVRGIPQTVILTVGVWNAMHTIWYGTVSRKPLKVRRNSPAVETGMIAADKEPPA